MELLRQEEQNGPSGEAIAHRGRARSASTARGIRHRYRHQPMIRHPGALVSSNEIRQGARRGTSDRLRSPVAPRGSAFRLEHAARMSRRTLLAAVLALTSVGCRQNPPHPAQTSPAPAPSGDSALPTSASVSAGPAMVTHVSRTSGVDRPPNTLGRIPILEYHLIGPNE